MVDRDYRDYYWLEQYRFSQVSQRFARTLTLSAEDFFCIVIWKANRAKSKIAGRLLGRGDANLQDAVAALLREVVNETEAKGRLRVLLKQWNLRLPMASAILTVLYPDDFTVYDMRVCEALGGFDSLADVDEFDDLWNGYRDFRSRVRSAAPRELSLRDQDRWLWGKSFAEQLARDVRTCFGKTRAGDEQVS
jgi:hypothetical protein